MVEEWFCKTRNILSLLAVASHLAWEPDNVSPTWLAKSLLNGVMSTRPLYIQAHESMFQGKVVPIRLSFVMIRSLLCMVTKQMRMECVWQIQIRTDINHSHTRYYQMRLSSLSCGASVIPRPISKADNLELRCNPLTELRRLT